MSLWDIIKKEGKQYLKDAMPGGLLNRELDYEGLRKAGEVTSMTPTPLGDIASGLLAVDDLRNKQYGSAALNSVGLLPFVPSLAGTFIGKNAQTWNQDTAQKAKQMAKESADPRATWKETGTMPGADKALRQEVSDDVARIKQFPSGPMSPVSAKMGDVLEHPELYKAYPDLADIPVVLQSNVNSKSTGAFYPDDNRIFYDAISPEDAKSGLLHELQHAIQQREGWASGGSPEGMRQILGNGELTGLYSSDELTNAYRRLAGEAEARATEARMNMNMEQRLNTFPADSYDIPLDQLIIRNLRGIKRN